MIPSLLTESAPSAGKATPRQSASSDDAVVAAFGDLMAAPEVDPDVTQVPIHAEGVAGVAEAEAEPSKLLAKQTDQQAPQDELRDLLAVPPETSRRGFPVAEAAIAQPTGIEKAARPFISDAPAPKSAPETGAGPKPPLTDKLDPKLAQIPSQRPSLAQYVVEGRLPRPALPEVASARVLAAMSQAPNGKDLPPRGRVVPTLDMATVAVPDGKRGPQALAFPQNALPEAARASRPDDTPRGVAEKLPPLPPSPKQSTTQPPAVAVAQVAAHARREVLETPLRAAEADVAVPVSAAERHAITPSVHSLASAAAPAETARHAATQIAMAITNTPGQAAEIALNPEELGRVRLSLSAGEGAITLHVLAERPETQELLRRHMDLLAQEFRQLGYTSISFTFGDQSGQTRADAAQSEHAQDAETEEVSEKPPVLPDQPRTGLDLRI